MTHLTNPKMHSSISHNALLCNTNVYKCAHLCYKVLHSGILVSCTVGFVWWVYWKAVITRTTRTPAFWGYPRRLMITHTIESYWIPSQKKKKSKLQILRICQIFQFLNFETNFTHDTPSEVLLKIQSGHDFVHRRTDGQTDRQMDRRTGMVKPVYPSFNFVETGGIITGSQGLLVAKQKLGQWWINN